MTLNQPIKIADLFYSFAETVKPSDAALLKLVMRHELNIMKLLHL